MPVMMPEMYVLTPEGRRMIERVMKKLFREDRLNGDQMRDLAQVLEAALRETYEFPEGSLWST